MKQTIVACIVITGLAALCPAGNWPNWRGPTGNGVAEAGQYPVEFSADSGLLWKVRLPGKGSSTPVVWGDDIFITCGIGQGEAGQDGVLCFDWTGKQKWQVKLGPQRKGK
ncbi:MAG: PQQ-binding-like beta-propeller repeat protein, partial [Phycisphaerae bacterium]|nr:PQQ-binding-like beta-propeller repeat protein [Phycisphaerae bacterium]